MLKLEKAINEIFNEYYVGQNGRRVVTCILDDNCVRYMVTENGKRPVRHEYSNNQKAICFERAMQALNK